MRPPAEQPLDAAVVGIAAAHPKRTVDVAFSQSLSRDREDHVDEAVDRDHLVRPDVYRTAHVRPHQAQRALEAFIDVEERARLPAVAPDLDLAAVGRQGDLAAYRGRRLLASALPGALGAEDVVVACDVHIEAVIAGIREVQALAEELLPAVLAVRIGGIGTVLGAVRIVRINLVLPGINAGRRG